MRHKILNTVTATILLVIVAAVGPMAQNVTRDYDDDGAYMDRVRVDRYLDVEVWTNHLDGDYHVGDDIIIHFRANRDAFVAIYSIDTRGRVNLLFPSVAGGDNFVYGGATYRLPGSQDDFDLVVTGPEGVENIQVIASRERFSIPDWYPVSGLICDWEDRHEYLDYINGRYFVRYDGQRFAFDRTAIYVYEWEPSYFQPIYSPFYPSWTVSGNVYIDYPWGASIYVDGIYWGCAPLYLPRVYVGWHTFTVYDHWGHSWESSVHVTRYNTVVLDRTVIVTRPETMSKYKEVRFSGYRNPVASGYPKFKEKKAMALGSTAPGVKGRQGGTRTGSDLDKVAKTKSRRFVRGTAELTATDRGLETVGVVASASKRSRGYSSGRSGSSKKTGRSSGGTVSAGSDFSSGRSSGTSSGRYGGSDQKRSYQRGSTGSRREKAQAGGTKGDSKGSQGYYRKKSGSTSKGKSGGRTIRSKGNTGSGKPGQSVKPDSKRGNSGGSKSTRPTVKQSGGGSKSGSSGTTAKPPSRSKSSGGCSKSGGGRR